MWQYTSKVTNNSIVFTLNSRLRLAVKAMQKLSSGLAINSAADAPASLIISEQLRASIGSLSQQIKNYEMVSHKYAYASSEINGLRSYLHELRSLALAAGNEAVNSNEAQEALHRTAEHLVGAFNTRIDRSEYNGASLLDGSEHALADIPHVNQLDLRSAAGAESALAQIDSALHALNAADIELGARQRYELSVQSDSWEVARENLIAAESTIRDADFGEVYTDYISHLLVSHANIALLAHSKTTDSLWLSLLKIKD